MNPIKLRQIVRAPAGENDAGGSDNTGSMAQAKEKVTSTARDAAARIKAVASDTADRAKSQAQRIAAETKDETAERIGGYGSAMHESAKNFEQQDPNIAWATHRVADRIQSVADYVRNSDFDDLRADAENFARRHPVAFFGGLFLGGLVIGNLLKAHRPGSDDSSDAEWDPGNQSGSADTSTEQSMMSGL